MSMRESDVWKHFKKVWPYHAERWEPGIGAGQPDTLVTSRTGQAGLIELKRSTKLVMRTSQKTWHRIWQKAGGRSVVLTCKVVRGRLTWMVWYGKAVFTLHRDEAMITDNAESMVRYVEQSLWSKVL